MRFRAEIRNPQDVLAGLMFAAIGVVVVAASSHYPMGTTRNIGPGYFPVVLGGVLVLLGGAIAFKGLRFAAPDAGSMGPWAIRPLVLVSAAVIAFALLVRPLGLAAATVALIVISSLAGGKFSLLRVIVLSAVLVALVALIFIHLLGLPFSLWPAAWN